MKPSSSYGTKTNSVISKDQRMSNLMFATHSGSHTRIKKSKLPLSFQVQDHMKQSGKLNEVFNNLFTDPL